MVTTTCFSVTGGVEVGLPSLHFWHQDWVSLDWFGQFTASQPFHSLTISIMNGFARLRFEFIIHNQCHTPIFESWVVTISVWGPYISHQDGAGLDWFKNFTASQPFQHLIISIMNGWRILRLVYVLYNGHHNVFFSHGRGRSWLACTPLLTSRLSEFGLIWAIHSISTLPFSHHKYNEWFCKVEIWIHHPQPMPHPYFWVMGGDNFGVRPLHFTPRWCRFGLIQEFHSISTLPTSHYKYNEWLENIEIGICAL